MSPATAIIEATGTSLAVPLNASQIEAACLLHQRLKQWKLADAALTHLSQTVPGFSPEACLLKSVAVNSLYGTQVFAIVRMANHICKIVAAHNLQTIGPGMVKQIANLPLYEDEQARVFTSFAAKFCHFFIDQERFPIYDEAAREAIKLHLGNQAVAEDEHDPYQAFCTNLARLRTAANIQGTGRNLDRYLWITGMYMKWLKLRNKPKAKQKMNVELRRLFENPSAVEAGSLEKLLPAELERAFKGGA